MFLIREFSCPALGYSNFEGHVDLRETRKKDLWTKQWENGEMLTDETFPKSCHRQGGFPSGTHGSWGGITDLFSELFGEQWLKSRNWIKPVLGVRCCWPQAQEGWSGKDKTKFSMEMCPVPGAPLLHNIQGGHKSCTRAGIPFRRHWSSDWTF